MQFTGISFIFSLYTPVSGDAGDTLVMHWCAERILWGAAKNFWHLGMYHFF